MNNFHGGQEVSTLAGGNQTILGGPVATWESIKLMSGDGGGAFNVNSAHPFENPTPLTNAVEIVAMLVIPVGFLRTFGAMVGDREQGWALFTAAAVLFVVATVAIVVATAVSHGLSEVLSAFTSSAANNGSAFAEISANTTWYNTALAFAMVIGRFIPIIAVLAIAGTLRLRSLASSPRER